MNARQQYSELFVIEHRYSVTQTGVTQTGQNNFSCACVDPNFLCWDNSSRFENYALSGQRFQMCVLSVKGSMFDHISVDDIKVNARQRVLRYSAWHS